MVDNYTILSKHIEFKKTSVHSVGKIQDIERYLKKFLDYINKPLNRLTEDDIAKFINSLKYSIRSVNDIKVYLKVFIKWYFEDWSSRFKNIDKLCKSQTPSKAYQPEQMISLEEIKKLIDGEQDLMYKVYWGVMFYGGFRPSECCRLEWNQIFFEPEGTIIKLHTSKTNKDYYKSIPREVEHLLKEWKEHNSSNLVFPSSVKEGQPIIARSVLQKLKRLSKRVLNKDVVTYALRHSIATILYSDDSIKDDDTAFQMGHSRSMKQNYLNLDVEKIKARSRRLWIKTKPLTPDERTEFEKLKKDVTNLMKDMEHLKKIKDYRRVAIAELLKIVPPSKRKPSKQLLALNKEINVFSEEVKKS